MLNSNVLAFPRRALSSGLSCGGTARVRPHSVVGRFEYLDPTTLGPSAFSVKWGMKSIRLDNNPLPFHPCVPSDSALMFKRLCTL